MLRLLVAFFLVITITIALLAAGVAFVRWRLRRHNRVSVQVDADPPLAWLGSPSTPARLHRRLRTSVTCLAAVPRRADDTGPGRARLCDELEAHAAALDEWLVWSARAPSRVRRDHYREIARQVREVEAMAVRISQLTPEAPGPAHRAGTPSALAELAEQLDVLEQAHAEVLEAERGAGASAIAQIEQAASRDQVSAGSAETATRRSSVARARPSSIDA